MHNDFADLGRFTEPALLVLISLANGDKHGYAIMQDAEALGGKLGPGTLYATLPRLEGRGWIEALPADARRRPYRLTSAGATALRTQLAGLAQLAHAGLRRLEAGA
jgi:DNA-binding PadR family transcriptional regulator